MICQRREDPLFDLRDTDKSLYFAKTEFNNCELFYHSITKFILHNYLREVGTARFVGEKMLDVRDSWLQLSVYCKIKSYLW